VVAAHRKELKEIDDVISEHVAHTAELIAQRSAVVAQAIDSQRTAILGAVYDLGSGQVDEVHRIGQV
jgi:carbonic anhydrase